MSEPRDELHSLINALPDDQVERLLVDARRRALARAVAPESAFAWIGSGRSKDGSTDVSTNPAYLEGFGRDSR